ncbi:MAG TPA: Xaa-Pro peptidase family protein, partial [Chloroflexota bacterium]|nr:Xaa-Pro peptidase family protein [Chloroflexota bacterium]
MHVHFSRSEFDARRDAVLAAMERESLDALLVFSQESMYYLTGYDSIGFVFFQCLVVGRDGRMVLLTRAPDRLQAKFTSIVQDIRVWVDGPNANPAEDLRSILLEYSLSGGSVGAELESYGLTAANWQRTAAALSSCCTLVDASTIIRELRVVKSPAEIEYVRSAARLADRALEAAITKIAPGAFEGDIVAALQSTILAGDGDFAAIDPIIGSGPGALLCRPYSGRRKLSQRDQITLEFCAVYRRYHAAIMRTIVVGEPTARHREMHAIAVEAMAACEAALRPGEPLGNVFDAHAKVCDRGGLRASRMNSTGYSLGSTFPPNWMERPMLYHGNPVLAEPGMVFHLHMILADEATGTSMCPGKTMLVTERGCESLSKLSLDL